MKRTTIPLDVEELALHKTFRELTEEEYTLVLQQLGSASAYTTLRSTLLAVQEHLAVDSKRVQPRPDIRARLAYALQEKHRKPSVFASVRAWVRSVATYKLPVWHTAAVGVAVLVGVLLLPQKHQQTAQEAAPRVVYVQAAEPTAHLDKEEIVQRVVDSLKEELTQQIRVQVAKEYQTEHHRALLLDTAREIVSAVLKSMETHHHEGVNNFVGLDNLPQLDVQKKGRTLAEDSSLSRFVVTAASERL